MLSGIKITNAKTINKCKEMFKGPPLMRLVMGQQIPHLMELNRYFLESHFPNRLF